jgi:heat shock protein 4
MPTTSARIALSPAHILAMLLAYLKQLAEADSRPRPPATDCVISGPYYFTQAPCRAYVELLERVVEPCCLR